MMMSTADPSCHDKAYPVTRDGLQHPSLSEINALCLKAARGAGLHWGEAEEAGWAASWLSRAGLAGPSITLEWLTEAARLARPAPAPHRWSATTGAQCPLRCGIALADFAGLPEGPGAQALTVERVAHPLIVLPFVARAAAWTGVTFEVRWHDHAVMPGTAKLAHLPHPAGGDSARAADLYITRVTKRPDAETTGERALPMPGVTVATWRALEALALRITVPTSSQSRTGAGAAGTDND